MLPRGATKDENDFSFSSSYSAFLRGEHEDDDFHGSGPNRQAAPSGMKTIVHSFVRLGKGDAAHFCGRRSEVGPGRDPGANGEGLPSLYLFPRGDSLSDHISRNASRAYCRRLNCAWIMAESLRICTMPSRIDWALPASELAIIAPWILMPSIPPPFR